MHRFALLVAALVSLWLPLSLQAQQGSDDNRINMYVDLKPAFVVNFGGVGKLRYLKTSITLRIDGRGQSSLRKHMPYIRHTLVMLLTRSSDESMTSMEGKETLRQEALAAVQAVLEAEEGQHFVTDLLFSSFVVQR
ncbi:MAG: flagellar FliL protein [Paraglaciecola psychrophila]|jgi:flagellar FliL protein